MKSTSTLYSCLAALCTIVTAQSTVSWPQQIDVELLYPRNTTYRPTFVFPFVFAIHNPTAIWPFLFRFTYDIDMWTPTGNRSRVYTGGFEPSTRWPTQSAPADGIADPLMVINATNALANVTEGRATLNWSIGYLNACGYIDEAGGTHGIFLEGSLNFTISNSSDVPSTPLNAITGCSKQVGSLMVTGEFRQRRMQPNLTCPYTEYAKGREGCGIQFNKTLAAQVMGVMLNGSSYSECEWPNASASSWAETCKSSTSAASALISLTFWGVILAGVFCASVLL